MGPGPNPYLDDYVHPAAASSFAAPPSRHRAEKYDSMGTKSPALRSAPFQDPIPFAHIPRVPEPSPFHGINTLDEPVLMTIKRDLKTIYNKIVIVMHPASILATRDGHQDLNEEPPPSGTRASALRDWDLWGPLFLCLLLAISLSVLAPPSESANIFTLIFFLVWLGGSIITCNTTLLGGELSFFQNICILGYCLAPLSLSACISILVRLRFVRAIYLSAAVIWSILASVRFLELVPALSGKRGLAIYPVVLFYGVVTWIIFIS